MTRTSAALALAAALMLTPVSAYAQSGEKPERLISVTGQGLVQARPDQATVTAGVVTQAATARAALTGNSSDMDRILQALKGGGIQERDLQTSGFSVEPVYTQPPNGYDGSRPFEPRIAGYRVSNNVTVRIRDLARTGEILDQVVSLGSNSVSGPAFEVAEPKPVQEEARRDAVADAVSKAKLYADAAGVALGPVTRIDESGGQVPQPMPMMAAKRESFADSAVPVEAGDLTFQAQVSVTWRIAD